MEMGKKLGNKSYDIALVNQSPTKSDQRPLRSSNA